MSTHAPTTGTGIEIDWEQLGKANYGAGKEGGGSFSWAEIPEWNRDYSRAKARAVVAALAQQGLVVMAATDVSILCGLAAGYAYLDEDREFIDRCAALVAAPGNEGEGA